MTTRTAIENERMLSPGSVLVERYRIVALLGVGGMGMVYRAHDMELDVEVALKVMRPERSNQEEMLARFRRELVLARQVTHYNVVRIHDIGADQGRLFLTMDYIDGRPLHDLLDKEGPLPVERAVHIATQLAHALTAAHAEGVVHRDLKPANILVTEDDRALITDFGIARSLADAELTQAGSVLGTPDYLSPEQARGEVVDGRADIYALGLILYRMLANELPFSGGTYEEVIAQHTAGHPRDISRTGVNVPRWLRRVISQCLQRDPADRYDDAVALARDLEQRDSRWMPRRIVRTAALVVATSITIGLVAAAWWLAGEQRAGETIAEERQTVVVLPLVEDGNGDEWAGEGFATVLAAQLGESEGLYVIAPERLARTVNDLGITPPFTDHDQRRLVELLAADWLISGALVQTGNSARVQLSVNSTRHPEASPRMLAANFDVGDGWLQAVDSLSASLRQQFTVPAPTDSPVALTTSMEALEAYVEGNEALQAGESVAALPLLQKATKLDAAFIAAWVALADTYSSLGRGDESLAAVQNAVEHLGPDAGRWSFIARAKQASLNGDAEEAERFLRELVAAYPNDIETRVDLAEAVGDAGRFTEAINDLANVVAEDPQHPQAWYLMGKFAILKGESQRAANDYLVRALVIQKKLGNQQGQADVFNAFGIAWHQLGNLELASEYYAQAVELRERVGDERGVVAALSNLARVQMLDGDYAGARQRLEDALARLEKIGDRHGVANLHNEIGILEEEAGDYVAALSRYRSALQIRQQLGDQRAIAESFNNVGYAYYLLGEYDNASVYLQQSLQSFRDMNNPDGEMQAQQTLGLLEIGRGNWTSATSAFVAALQTAREIDFPHAAAMSHGNLGYIAQLQGRYASAAESYEQAVEIMERVGDPRGLAEFTLHYAEMALELGMTDAGAKRLAKARDALGAADNTEQSAWLTVLEGRFALLRDDREEARRRMEKAVALAEQSGSRIARLRAGAGMVQLLLVSGRHAEALQEAARYRAAADVAGNVPMRLLLRRLEAEAALAAGDPAQASGVLQEAQKLVRKVGEYADRWLLHELAGTAAAAVTGRAAEHEQARIAFEQLRKNMNEVQRLAFDVLWPRSKEGSDE